MALVYVVAQLIDAGFLIPLMVIAQIVRLCILLNIAIVVVIIAGAQVMGILGMIISIPVASTFEGYFD